MPMFGKQIAALGLSSLLLFSGAVTAANAGAGFAYLISDSKKDTEGLAAGAASVYYRYRQV